MRLRVSQKHVPLLATIAVFALLYAIASCRYENFLSLRVFVNLLINCASLGVIAVGMTFVILSGGIDLSVGSMMALSSVVLALLMESWGLHPLLAMGVVLVLGAGFGLLMGCGVRYLGLAPFIVTLAALFLARGVALVLCDGAANITNEFYAEVTSWALPLTEKVGVPLTALVFVVVLLVGICVSVWTAFGRNVYAVGGNEEAAMLMGVPVGRTKLLVYSLSGGCSALAGILFTLNGSSGDPRAGVGNELEAIAAVVVGGTLLTGGVGYVFGTLIGVLILGIIQMGIDFEGTLAPGWVKVAIGLLLLLFILLQKLVARTGLRRAR